MRVVATAGHVDHGKSTLVRALTGMEPDRWAEERRRGMTIDLGYAWTTVGDGTELAFVDVPGHQRFIGNMLAGIGPAPGVLFVVAADEGWSRQSSEHLAALDALEIRHGVLAVTRCDLADPAPALAEAREHLAASSLGSVEAVAVSPPTGSGLDELRAALGRLVARLLPGDDEAPARLWVDRVFTVRGSGTVVTGTLVSGSINVDDVVELRGREVRVRGMQALGRERAGISAPARVALNLRGIARDAVERGDVVCTPGAWFRTAEIDVRVRAGGDLPQQLVLHVGTAALPVRLRRLAGGGSGEAVLARVRMSVPLPVRAGDRGVLRDPGRQTVAGGVLVLDADPPALRRRGAAAARARELAAMDGTFDAALEVARRGVVAADRLRALGGRSAMPPGARIVGPWVVAERQWDEWCAAAAPTVAEHARRKPLEDGMPVAALRRALDMPDDAVATAVALAAGLPVARGRVGRASGESLGPLEDSIKSLERRLAGTPFAAPETAELAELALGRRELAAAERAGRLLRVTGEIVLLPDAPQRAAERLRELPQPFTTSAARQALGTTRRVAIPLLEYLDAHGLTERIDGNTRRLR